ncbi:uncharacterized protein LOC118204952 [Stegodyphus dumicola]|uniref:uncharacterized protein LOC118204952 n=1 Tax=Stegodyphus dumicola TaxID=202533 RepID=UPI0015A8CF25|nr:uncharacterized protein LOC118204952 [Stegodyphus dumicola]
MNGIPIKCAPNLKYLGLTFNNKLSWVPHLKEVKQKINSLTNNMLKTARIQWGTPANILRSWYRTISERIILYGAAIWRKNISSHMSKLMLTIQRMQLLLICRGYRTTSTAAFQVLAGIPPLDLQAERESLLKRVLRLDENATLWNHNYYHTDYEKHKPVLLGHPADIDLSDSIQLVYASSKKNSFSLYRDGSKPERGAGSAFCALQGETIIKTWKRRLDIRNTVFQTEVAELKAAIKFAVYSLRFRATIFSDSASSLAAIRGNKSRSSYVQELKKILLHCPPSLRPHLV